MRPYTYHLHHHLHIRVCHYFCQIYIVCMVTVRMGSEPVLSIKWPVSIDTMINFDGAVTDTDTETVRVNRPLFYPYSNITENRKLAESLHTAQYF